MAFNDLDGWLPAHLLLELPSGSFQNGMYQVVMEFANAAKNPIPVATTAAVRLRVDNSYPNGTTSFFSGLDWREAGGTWHHLGAGDLVCPVMPRRHHLREPQRLPRPMHENDLRQFFENDLRFLRQFA